MSDTTDNLYLAAVTFEELAGACERGSRERCAPTEAQDTFATLLVSVARAVQALSLSDAEAPLSPDTEEKVLRAAARLCAQIRLRMPNDIDGFLGDYRDHVCKAEATAHFAAGMLYSARHPRSLGTRR